MRLLVVEDEQRLGAALRRGLTAEGFLVDVAADGPAGLEALLVFDHQQAHGTQPVTVDEGPHEFSVGSQADWWKMGP